MAERFNWILEADNRTLSVAMSGDVLKSFELSKIFPGIDTLPMVQRMIVVYGVKQRLSDKVAGMKEFSAKEKVMAMTKRFDDMAKGIWRVTGPGIGSVKARAQALAKEGLTEEQEAVLKKLGLL
jgi:hypothetical protein